MKYTRDYKVIIIIIIITRDYNYNNLQIFSFQTLQIFA